MTIGTLLIMVGPSGAGKDTITAELAQVSSFRKFPSGTTRPMRPGESQGYPYTFASGDEFDRLKATEDLFNYLIIGGYFYFLDAVALREALECGQDLVLHFIHSEALRLKEFFPEALIALIILPSIEEQKRRLVSRGASQEEIERRMGDANVQNPPEVGCDLVLVNETDQLPKTLRRLQSFLHQARK